MSIYRYTIEPRPGDRINTLEESLETAASLRALADDLVLDGFYGEAGYYDHAARKCGRGCVWEFVSSTLDYYPELPEKARRRLPTGWSKALECGKTVTVTICRY